MRVHVQLLQGDLAFEHAPRRHIIADRTKAKHILIIIITFLRVCTLVLFIVPGDGVCVCVPVDGVCVYLVMVCVCTW